jgi:hypothetical protein
MGRNNILKPYFKVPVPFIPEVEKERDNSDGNPPQIKITVDAEGNAIANTTTQIQPIFNQGTLEQYSKWINSLNTILQGQSVTEHYCLALQSLRGTGKAFWQHDCRRSWSQYGISYSTVDQFHDEPYGACLKRCSCCVISTNATWKGICFSENKLE